MRASQSGFTLIELVIVIILLGILGATITPRFVNTQDNARLAVVQAGVGAVQSAALITFADNQGQAVSEASILGNLEGVVDNGNCGASTTAVEFSAAFACAAVGDTNFTLQHCGDVGQQASGVIPEGICI